MNEFASSKNEQWIFAIHPDPYTPAHEAQLLNEKAFHNLSLAEELYAPGASAHSLGCTCWHNLVERCAGGGTERCAGAHGWLGCGLAWFMTNVAPLLAASTIASGMYHC